MVMIITPPPPPPNRQPESILYTLFYIVHYKQYCSVLSNQVLEKDRRVDMAQLQYQRELDEQRYIHTRIPYMRLISRLVSKLHPLSRN